jgi:hypothetical protein
VFTWRALAPLGDAEAAELAAGPYRTSRRYLRRGLAWPGGFATRAGPSRVCLPPVRAGVWVTTTAPALLHVVAA